MKKFFILLIILVGFSCVSIRKGKEYKFTSGEYFFIIQLQSINKDTISFKTIDIYSPFPIIKNPVSKTSPIEFVNFPLEEITKGKLKNVRKKDIGKILLLQTNYNFINKNYFIHFNYVKNREINLSKMHQLGVRSTTETKKNE